MKLYKGILYPERKPEFEVKDKTIVDILTMNERSSIHYGYYDEDFERLNQFKWCAAKIYGGNFYAMRDSLLPDGTRKRILMHRIIMNTPKGFLILPIFSPSVLTFYTFEEFGFCFVG